MSSSMTILILVYLVLAIFIALIVFLVVWLVRRYRRSRRAQNMHPEFCESLGENLKKYREACGMSRETVAKVLDTSNREVAGWENGTIDPGTADLYALSKLYEIPIEDLLKNVKGE